MSAHRKGQTKHAHHSETTSGIQKKTQQSTRSKSRLEMYILIMTSKSMSYSEIMSIDMEMESKIYCESKEEHNLPGDGDACCAT